ncbi:twin-arginine translocation signal domain-containing protein [Vibrio hangzhouensis]|uniref:Formate dehydrogenase region TAT target n=1 Tax=Vibrio hangzhouensis TaxID=462991 RepID=A0A1H5WDH6_9VIBR|nr:twin-arginine translocation signal domain-containing protein [Vibrio hangzhouensis]MBY6196737.1 twin-arginine translocation signal domain-containing protein [Vibrio hangzhouensis]SEF97512.1 formate dehydrogenase region TAT target [Vibrio hangzhouensis]
MSKQTKRDDKSDFNENRRNLLKGLTTAAVAGAVISGTAHAATDTELVDVKPDDEKKTGYRETQHVKDYYDTL